MCATRRNIEKEKRALALRFSMLTLVSLVFMEEFKTDLMTGSDRLVTNESDIALSAER